MSNPAGPPAAISTPVPQMMPYRMPSLGSTRLIFHSPIADGPEKLTDLIRIWIGLFPVVGDGMKSPVAAVSPSNCAGAVTSAV